MQTVALVDCAHAHRHSLKKGRPLLSELLLPFLSGCKSCTKEVVEIGMPLEPGQASCWLFHVGKTDVSTTGLIKRECKAEQRTCCCRRPSHSGMTHR